jgi:hypothetical protein
MKFYEYETRKLKDIRELENEGHKRQADKLRKMSAPEFLEKMADNVVKRVGNHVRNSLETMMQKMKAEYGGDVELTRISDAEGAMVIGAQGIHAAFCTMAEMDWFDDNRPFYNVYPIVEKLTNNTKLTVPLDQLHFPHSVMCFRFPKGQEPLGIKTALIKLQNFGSRGAQIFKPIFEPSLGSARTKNILDNMLAVGHFSTVETDDQFMINVPRPPLYTAKTDGEPVTVEDLLHLASQILTSQPHDVATYMADVSGTLDFVVQGSTETPESQKIYLQRLYFLFKLSVLVSMVAAGNDLITPAILASEQEKYDTETDEAARRWMEERAAKIQGRGFDFGRELQTRSETSPHWRNPHMALYWIGEGRTKPVLKLRAGSIVIPKHISSVPTGFDCPVVDDAEATVQVEYVYFLRDPSRGFVKIGRTRRRIADRQRESSTFVPGGLSLLGYISTGDCTELETRIHREYAHKRRGNEFFEISDVEVAEIVTQFGGVLQPSEN